MLEKTSKGEGPRRLEILVVDHRFQEDRFKSRGECEARAAKKRERAIEQLIKGIDFHKRDASENFPLPDFDGVTFTTTAYPDEAIEQFPNTTSSAYHWLITGLYFGENDARGGERVLNRLFRVPVITMMVSTNSSLPYFQRFQRWASMGKRQKNPRLNYNVSPEFQMEWYGQNKFYVAGQTIGDHHLFNGR